MRYMKTVIYCYITSDLKKEQWSKNREKLSAFKNHIICVIGSPSFIYIIFHIMYINEGLFIEDGIAVKEFNFSLLYITDQ